MEDGQSPHGLELSFSGWSHKIDRLLAVTDIFPTPEQWKTVKVPTVLSYHCLTGLT